MSRRTFLLALNLVIGMMMIVDYFFSIPVLNSWSATLRAWGVIVSTFALGVGAVNLLMVHGRRVSAAPTKNWPSLVMLAGLVVTAGLSIFAGPNSEGSLFVYEGIIMAVHQAVSSMLGMFICSAAYRAFRFRNAEASVMLCVGILVLLAQIPSAEAVAPWLAAPSQWVMNSINVAGQRGIIISSGIALVGLSLRVILGIDKSYLGSE